MYGISVFVVVCTMLIKLSPLHPKHNIQTQPSFWSPSHLKKEKWAFVYNWSGQKGGTKPWREKGGLLDSAAPTVPFTPTLSSLGFGEIRRLTKKQCGRDFQVSSCTLCSANADREVNRWCRAMSSSDHNYQVSPVSAACHVLSVFFLCGRLTIRTQKCRALWLFLPPWLKML